MGGGRPDLVWVIFWGEGLRRVSRLQASGDEGDVGIGQETLGASGGLGAEGDAADDEDIERHR